MFQLNHTIKMILIISIKIHTNVPSKEISRQCQGMLKSAVCSIKSRIEQRAFSHFLPSLSYLGLLLSFASTAEPKTYLDDSTVSVCVVALNGFLDNSSERNQKIVTTFGVDTRLLKFTISQISFEKWTMNQWFFQIGIHFEP